MQSVLGGVLGLSILLAWWIGRQRAASLEPALGEIRTYANDAMPLSLRLPAGFDAEVRFDGDHHPIILLLIEDKPQFGIRRRIGVQVDALDGNAPAPTPEKLIGLESGHRAAHLPASQVDFLNTRGALVEIPATQELDEDGEMRMMSPLVLAAAVLPGRAVAVTIELRGPRAIAPADEALVRKIAQSMSIADPKKPVGIIGAQNAQ